MILLFTCTGALYGLVASAVFLVLLSADEPPYDLGGWRIAAILLGIVVGSSLLSAGIGALFRRFGWLGKKLKPSPMTTVRLARAGIGLVALLLLVAVVAGSIFVRSKWNEGIQQPQAVLGAGVCAVIAASLAFIAAVLNAVETGANRVQTHSREVERALHERYSAAADQLGDEDATFAKRIGGVYALAAVADDWLEYDPTRTFEAEVAVDLMCAYLRANTTHRDWKDDKLAQRGEESVREALIVLFREHTYLPEIREKERKRGRPWRSPDVSFNLDGADLTQIDWTNLRLHGIQLRDSNLTQAYLNRSKLVDADLTGAKLVDAELIGCDLSNSVMENADLRGADLTGATLKADQLTQVYSGPSPLPESDKVTIWPKGLTPLPPPRSPDTETETTSPSQPPKTHGKTTSRRRHPSTQTSTSMDPT